MKYKLNLNIPRRKADYLRDFEYFASKNLDYSTLPHIKFTKNLKVFKDFYKTWNGSFSCNACTS